MKRTDWKGRLVAFLLLGLLGCGASYQRVIPPDFPEMQGGWVGLTQQVPSSARVVLLSTIEGSFCDALSSVLLDLHRISDLCALTGDALGVDLDEPASVEQLGLLLGGGIALFLYQDMWVGVVDLVDADSMRTALRRAQQRNPDLQMSWRRVGGDAVLRIATEVGVTAPPRVNAMLTDRQLIVLVDLAAVPAVSLTDAVLEHTRDGSWGENVLFHPVFWEAIQTVGGDPQALHYFEGSALFTSHPWDRAPSTAATWFGAPPPAERCREVASLISEGVPHGFGVLRRSLESGEQGSGQREFQQLTLRLDEDSLPRVAALFPPVTIEHELLEREATASAFLQVQPGELTRQLRGWGDVAGCPGPVSILGMLGRIAAMAARYPELLEVLDGLVGAVLVELRSLSRIPYPDLLLVLGTQDPARLSGLISSALESELGVAGSAQSVSGLPAVQYRVALLYRLTLYQGISALGVSLGRVSTDWVASVLSRTETPGDAFFGFFLDGQRLRGAISAMADIAAGDVPDPELAEGQRMVLDRLLGDLSDLAWMRVVARLRDGAILLESNRFAAHPDR
ncbi:MAG: hypothetical protein JW797_06235 [Bradymonadales bacterium]|nr:hypothetical protein [Bradymonadales bacterium]